MADNVTLPGTGLLVACDEVAYSGDTTKVQLFRLVHVSGAEGAKAISEVVAASGSPAASAVTVQRPVVSTFPYVTDGTDAVNIKASAGILKSIHVLSERDSPLFICFHNTAGTPALGSAVVFKFGVQAGLPRDLMIPDGGRAFSTGIGMTVVSGMALTNADAVDAEDAIIEVCYV